MKLFHKDIIVWILIILFVILLFIIYEQKNDRYIKLEKNQPETKQFDPVVAKKTKKLVQEAAQHGISVVITEKFRTKKEQNELYAQGRTASGNIVTYAKGGESYHNYGLAVDYALKNDNGEIIWNTSYDGNNNGQADWFEVADLAKELGFEWGGDWRNPDFPHLQMDFGLSIRQLQDGLRPKHNQNKTE
ncbi:peptidoglycan L-alanyl-D-glutamate endopeptidase CwlK [Virgibacillus siamensis]|uniref:Peptidoglycan L-alanyl-D-glutamate endopeptidase CwlK n=1 Tax=Virgibacillus siamensis TaxID=480071 RepID=A0ABP3QVE2_9BACI